MANIISPLLLILGAFFKAVSDTLESHFDVSIFKNLNRKWWDPAVSWQYVGYLPHTHYHLDAWHLSNSIYIFSLVLATAFYHSIFNPWIDAIVFSFLFIVGFNLFYNKILRK